MRQPLTERSRQDCSRRPASVHCVQAIKSGDRQILRREASPVRVVFATGRRDDENILLDVEKPLDVLAVPDGPLLMRIEELKGVPFEALIGEFHPGRRSRP